MYLKYQKYLFCRSNGVTDVINNIINTGASVLEQHVAAVAAPGEASLNHFIDRLVQWYNLVNSKQGKYFFFLEWLQFTFIVMHQNTNAKSLYVEKLLASKDDSDISDLSKLPKKVPLMTTRGCCNKLSTALK